MPAVAADPEAARDFALTVVSRLREAGHEAFWAGGCVRDELLGRTPADYDVATSARPEVVRELFGRRRTLAVGAAFGVMTIVGPRGAGHVEVQRASPSQRLKKTPNAATSRSTACSSIL